MVARALAELCEANVRRLTELEANRDQDGVDVDAMRAFKLEEHVDVAGVVDSAAEHPSASAKDSASEHPHKSCRFFEGRCFHAQRPRRGCMGECRR